MLIKQPRLEKEDGIWQYEVLIKVGKTTKEVNVDAEHGKITSVETTSAAEEAKELKAESAKSNSGKKSVKTKVKKDEEGEKD